METKNISEIEQTKSFNKSSVRGDRILKNALKELGCTRSIVVDRNNKVLCGNKVLQKAKEVGIERVRIVESMGNELIVVKRTDIDLNTRKAKEIMLVDNLTSELGLQYDTNYILEVMNTIWGFDPRKYEGHSCLVKELTVEECIQEGIEAAQRKDKRAQESETTETQDTLQLSLF